MFGQKKKQNTPLNHTELCITFNLSNTEENQMLNSIILRYTKTQPFCLQYKQQYIPFEYYKMFSITTLKRQIL